MAWNLADYTRARAEAEAGGDSGGDSGGGGGGGGGDGGGGDGGGPSFGDPGFNPSRPGGRDPGLDTGGDTGSEDAGDGGGDGGGDEGGPSFDDPGFNPSQPGGRDPGLDVDDSGAGDGDAGPSFGDPGFNPSAPGGRDPGLGAGDGVDTTSTTEYVADFDQTGRDRRVGRVYRQPDPEVTRRRSSAVSDAIRGDPDVAQFDPDRDIERVAPGAFTARVITDEGVTETRRFAFDEGAQDVFQRRARRRFQRQAEEDLERQTGVDVDAEEDIDIEETDEGFQAAPTDRFIRELAERDIEEQIERAVAFQRAGVTTSGGAGGLVTEGVDLEPGEDFTVERIEQGGFRGELTEDLQRDLASEQAGQRAQAELERDLERSVGLAQAGVTTSGGAGGLNIPRADLERGEDFTIERTPTGGFRAELDEPIQLPATPAPEREAEERYGDIEIQDVTDIPITGGAAQLYSDIYGRDPLAVSDIPRRVDLRTETATGTRRGGPGPGRQVTEERVVGVDVETFEEGATVEDALGLASAEYDELVAEVAEANIEYNPAVRAASDVASRFGFEEESERGEELVQTTTEDIGGLLNVPETALTVKEAAEFVPFAVEETAAGRLGVSYDPSRTTTTAFGDEVSAPLELEEEGLAPDLSQDIEEIATEGIEYAQEEPVEATVRGGGTLIGSAFLFGGASAVSRRTGTAARFTIQPGEEALGYGGAAATRRVAGRETAERLFPQNEPLIFSEEFAIRQAKGASAAARRQLDRARGAAGRVNVRGRPGALLGGFEVEFEPEVEEPDLGVELDPFDVSDLRLRDPARTFGEAEGLGQTTDPTAPELPQDIGPGIGPRGEAGGFRGGSVEENFETYLREARQRQRMATRQRLESSLDTPELEEDGRLGLELEPEAALERFDPLTDVMFRQDFRTDLRFDTEFETEAEAESRRASEFELEQEAEQVSELERELELEFEAETEAERELETEPLSTEQQRLSRDRGVSVDGLFTRRFEFGVTETPGEDIDREIESISEGADELFEDL